MPDHRTPEQYKTEQRDKAGPGDPLLVPVKTGKGVEFPGVCPACGAHADRALRVERVFPGRVVHGYRIPFCAKCLGRHRELLPARDPLLFFRRLLKGDGTSIGGLFICAVAAYFTKEAVRTLSPVLAVFSLLPWAVGGSLLFSVWRKNHYLAVEPATQVTAAVEFSGDVSREFEPAWEVFQFRDAGYATRFRAMNALRLWEPGGEEARDAKRSRDRKSRRNSYLMYCLLAVALVFALWEEYLQPIYQAVRGWLDR